MPHAASPTPSESARIDLARADLASARTIDLASCTPSTLVVTIAALRQSLSAIVSITHPDDPAAVPALAEAESADLTAAGHASLGRMVLRLTSALDDALTDWAQRHP